MMTGKIGWLKLLHYLIPIKTHIIFILNSPGETPLLSHDTNWY